MTMTPGTSGSLREAQKARTRNRIVEAARTVFEQHGYAGTSIGLVTAEASVNRATFYLHFPHKAAVFREVVALDRTGADQLWRELDRALLLGTREAVGGWVRGMTSWVESNASLMPARHEAMAADPEFAAELQPRFDRIFEELDGYLGSLDPGAREAVRARLQLLIAMLDQMFLHAWVHGAWTGDRERFLDAAADIWCASLDLR